ncbi:hypothetical protein C8J57DRAFT_1530000 [Mycena rebaudengoi]|nr:hypothetical protein C8J57DRAFT_1530000 [Mycena rebaudengoi]
MTTPTTIGARHHTVDTDGQSIYSCIISSLRDPQTKKFNLAAYEFRETFERKLDDEGRFGRYVSDGHKFTATIVAEVGSEKEGSWFAAYPKNAPPANKLPLNDNSSSHRMVIAARSPTAAPEEIVRNWNDSLATVDGVRGVDADDEANNNEKFHKITEWVVNADSNSTEPGNLMILRLPPTYEVNYFLLLISAQATPKRRARVVKSTATPKKTEDVDMTASLTERRIGDTYDPNLLPDHRGPYFNHKDAKLIQRDIRDHDDTLIAPHELYSRLTEGTLFTALVTFETYVYHIHIERLKVIDRGYGIPWHHPAPTLPSTPTKRARDPDAEANKAANTAFESLSPTKKSKAFTF